MGSIGYCTEHPTVVVAAVLLRQRPRTAQQLATELGLYDTTTRRLLNWMEKAQIAEISTIIRSGNTNIRIWGARSYEKD